jgi:hypothetical protein
MCSHIEAVLSAGTGYEFPDTSYGCKVEKEKIIIYQQLEVFSISATWCGSNLLLLYRQYDRLRSVYQAGDAAEDLATRERENTTILRTRSVYAMATVLCGMLQIAVAGASGICASVIPS